MKKCRVCNKPLPIKKEQDCEHYKDNLCCFCFLDETDDEFIEEILK